MYELKRATGPQGTTLLGLVGPDKSKPVKWAKMPPLCNGYFERGGETLARFEKEGYRVIIPVYATHDADTLSAIARMIEKEGQGAVRAGMAIKVRRQRVDLTPDLVFAGKGRHLIASQESYKSCVEPIRSFVSYTAVDTPESMTGSLVGRELKVPYCSYYAVLVSPADNVVAVSTGTTLRFDLDGKPQILTFYAYANRVPYLIREGVDDAVMRMGFDISFLNSAFVHGGRHRLPSFAFTEADSALEVVQRQATGFGLLDLPYVQPDLSEYYNEDGRILDRKAHVDLSRLKPLKPMLMQIEAGGIITPNMPYAKVRAVMDAILDYYNAIRDASRALKKHMFGGIPRSAEWVYDPERMAYRLSA